MIFGLNKNTIQSNTATFLIVFQVRGPRDDPRPVHIEFMVEKVEIG
jgi:hypothetical protein